MKTSKKPNLRDLKSLSYDEMRTIKGGYSGGSSCYREPICSTGCAQGGVCSYCCVA